MALLLVPSALRAEIFKFLRPWELACRVRLVCTSLSLATAAWTSLVDVGDVARLFKICRHLISTTRQLREITCFPSQLVGAAREFTLDHVTTLRLVPDTSSTWSENGRDNWDNLDNNNNGAMCTTVEKIPSLPALTEVLVENFFSRSPRRPELEKVFACIPDLCVQKLVTTEHALTPWPFATTLTSLTVRLFGWEAYSRLAQLHALEHLDITIPGIKKISLHWLHTLPKLRSFRLVSRPKLSTEELESISACRALNSLQLNTQMHPYTTLGFEGLQELIAKEPNILRDLCTDRFDLRRTNLSASLVDLGVVDDSALFRVSESCPKLKNLTVCVEQDEAYGYLEYLPDFACLERLILSLKCNLTCPLLLPRKLRSVEVQNKEVSFGVFSALLTCPGLEHLALEEVYVKGFSEENQSEQKEPEAKPEQVQEALAPSSTLLSLLLNGDSDTPEWVVTFALQNAPKLQYLDVGDFPCVWTGSLFDEASKLQSLADLQVERAVLDHRSIAALRLCPSLRNLTFDRPCKFEDALCAFDVLEAFGDKLHNLKMRTSTLFPKSATFYYRACQVEIVLYFS